MDKINHHPLDNSKVFDGSTYTTNSNLTTGLRHPILNDSGQMDLKLGLTER